MAVGKNKRLTRGGKKGAKKKAGDPFQRKEWYDLKAPSMFQKRSCGKTIVSKTQGTKVSSDSLKGRVAEINLGDLYTAETGANGASDEDQSFKKMRMSIEDVQGRKCLLDFHGMDFTRDKLCHLVRKWQSLIEAHTEVKTTDGYTLRVFVIGFTNRQGNQAKSNCYAQSAQIKRIRQKMVEIINADVSKTSLRENVKKFIASSIEKDIIKKTSRIFPLKDVYIRKVKVLKKPKFDITKLMELHGGEGDDAGAEMVVEENEEAVNTLTAEMKD